MADNKYYGYSKLSPISPYQPGKAGESAFQRKNDFAAAKTPKAPAQPLSSGKKGSSAKSLAQSLAGSTVNMDSLLSSSVGSKISKTAGQSVMSGGSLDTVLSNIGSKISKKA